MWCHFGTAIIRDPGEGEYLEGLGTSQFMGMRNRFSQLDHEVILRDPGAASRDDAILENGHICLHKLVWRTSIDYTELNVRGDDLILSFGPFRRTVRNKLNQEKRKRRWRSVVSDDKIGKSLF